MRHLKRNFAIAAIVLGLLSAGASLFVYLGVYNISALEQHTLPVYRLLQFAMRRAVAVRNDVVVPDLDQVDWRNRGFLLYQKHCEQCHGGPGVAPQAFSLGMVPAPTAVMALARKRSAADIHWVVTHGIKMTGMPAWEYRLSDEEKWQVVAFVKQVANMTSADYAQLHKQASWSVADRANRNPSPQKTLPTNPVETGRIALQQYNCISCHSIPGLTAASHDVGPPLGGITQRAFIAGILPYSDENMVRWIRSPTKMDPKTTMPDLGVTEAHARSMLAYFYSIDNENAE